MPSLKDFTPEQKAAIAELLIAGKRFVLAGFPNGAANEKEAAERLTNAIERLAKAVDDD